MNETSIELNNCTSVRVERNPKAMVLLSVIISSIQGTQEIERKANAL